MYDKKDNLNRAETLVIGLGSEILTDDGLACCIIRDLKTEFQQDDIDFATALTWELGILDLISSYSNVILIDETLTGTKKPGEIYFWNTAMSYMAIHLNNQHDFSLGEAVQLGDLMGLKMPGRIQIIAVEIYENKTFSDQLSEQINKIYPEILCEISSYIRNMLSVAEGINHVKESYETF
jgi:hydrogenase maturation protease